MTGGLVRREKGKISDVWTCCSISETEERDNGVAKVLEYKRAIDKKLHVRIGKMESVITGIVLH